VAGCAALGVAVLVDASYAQRPAAPLPELQPDPAHPGLLTGHELANIGFPHGLGVFNGAGGQAFNTHTRQQEFGAHPASAPPSYAYFRPKRDPIRPQPRLPSVSAGWATLSHRRASSRLDQHSADARSGRRAAVRPRWAETPASSRKQSSGIVSTAATARQRAFRNNAVAGSPLLALRTSYTLGRSSSDFRSSLAPGMQARGLRIATRPLAPGQAEALASPPSTLAARPIRSSSRPLHGRSVGLESSPSASRAARGVGRARLPSTTRVDLRKDEQDDHHREGPRL
jgi:hypothetical protein